MSKRRNESAVSRVLGWLDDLQRNVEQGDRHLVRKSRKKIMAEVVRLEEENERLTLDHASASAVVDSLWEEVDRLSL